MPSQAGTPVETFIAIRPKIEERVTSWANSLIKNQINESQNKKIDELIWKWSPLFQTEPIGGPKGQNPYINAVLVVEGRKLQAITPSGKAALTLLNQFLSLESEFGRNRNNVDSIRWGPRTLDIDLLAWGSLQVQSKKLTIPHPHLLERSFVIVPLGAAISSKKNPPKKITEQKWPESREDKNN